MVWTVPAAPGSNWEWYKYKTKSIAQKLDFMMNGCFFPHHSMALSTSQHKIGSKIGKPLEQVFSKSLGIWSLCECVG